MAPSRAHLLVNRIRLNSRPVSHPFYRTRLLHANRRKLIHDSPCSHNTASLSRMQACQQLQSQRLYSTSETLEPPDHLDDREQKIFRQLRDALDPVSLQVCCPEFPNFNDFVVLGQTPHYEYANQALTGPGHLRRMRYHVRGRNNNREIQRSAGDKTA